MTETTRKNSGASPTAFLGGTAAVLVGLTGLGACVSSHETPPSPRKSFTAEAYAYVQENSVESEWPGTILYHADEPDNGGRDMIVIYKDPITKDGIGASFIEEYQEGPYSPKKYRTICPHPAAQTTLAYEFKILVQADNSLRSVCLDVERTAIIRADSLGGFEVCIEGGPCIDDERTAAKKYPVLAQALEDTREEYDERNPAPEFG